MRLKVLGLGAAAGVLSIVIGSFVGISAASSIPNSNAETKDPKEVVALLGQPAARVTAPPSDVTEHGDGGITSSSVRSLGRAEGASYWVALDKADNICLIAELEDGTTGSSCHTAASVEEFGLELGIGGNESLPGHQELRLILLPDSAEAAGKSPWSAVGSNLVVAKQGEVQAGDKFSFTRESTQKEPITVIG